MTIRPRILAAIAAGLLVAACGGGGDDDAAPSTTERSTTTTTRPPPTAPLTGAPPADESVLDRPALAVKVDATPSGRSRQTGLHEADVVYVQQVEGGVTRLVAIYQSRDAAAVGPVRSARDTDLSVLAPLDTPLFAFSGGRPVLPRVYAADLVEVGYPNNSGLYEQRGSGVYRLFLPTAAAFARAPDGSPAAKPLFAYGDAPFGERTGGASLSYGRTRVGWEVEGDRFVRSQDGSFHEVDGEPIRADNVVVQFVGYRDTGIRDTSGAVSPAAVMVGEGDAWILSGGRLMAGRWQRGSADEVTTYTDVAGNPLSLLPGTTWVELVPVGGGTMRPVPNPAS